MKNVIVSNVGAVVLVVSGITSGCLQMGESETTAERSPTDTATDQAAIIDGGAMNPEYTGHVKLTDPEGMCSGTLLTNRTIITAEHCISSADLTNPARLRVAMGGQFAGASTITLHPTLDVAIVRMDKAFWADTAAVVSGGQRQRKGRNIPLQSSMLGGNRPVTCFGYGINVRNGGGEGTLRSAEMTAEVFGTSPHIHYHPNGSDQIMAAGDSGGGCLSLAGNFPFQSWVFESVTDLNTPTTENPTFARGVWVAPIRDFIEPLLSTCSHDLCRAGAPLEASCDTCASAVCNADPFCCSDGWDAQCVGEIATFCGTPTCNVSCGHDICNQGSAISTGCDTCAATICQTDPFCCNNGWDGQCVGEVGSLCNRACD